MTVYSYKATDKSGKFIEGDIDASDYHAAIEQIRQLNYFPIRVAEGKNALKLSEGLKFSLPSFGSTISTKDLMTITQQLATLVDSGLTLDEGLSTLVKLAETEKIRSILSDIRKRVHAGTSFAEALAEYPDVFSKLYINMVRAGEAGGMVGEALSRLEKFLEKSVTLKSNIRSAMVYPTILFLVGASAVVILITFVVPQFAKLFEDMGAALPLPTKILMSVSALIIDYWPILLLTLLVSIGGFKFHTKTIKGRLWWDGLLLKLPLIGSLIRKIEVSRFSLTMATLLKSGVPVLQAMGIVQSILINRIISDAVGNLRQALKRGKGLSGPLQEARVFPPMAVQMITVGEASGSLENMLTRVSQTYDKEVEQAIKQLISMIEPFMILFIALVIGFIVVSMLLAIIGANEIVF
jgi:type II secretion system protein F